MPDLEGTRASYMYDLIRSTPDYAWFRRQLLDSLRDAGDDWHGVQRFRICQYMAEDGDIEANRAVFDNFHIGPQVGAQMCLSLHQLRGIKGMLFAAEKLGELALLGQEVFNEGIFLWSAKRDLDEEAVEKALQDASRISPARGCLPQEIGAAASLHPSCRERRRG